jgi:uncharacterized protein
MTETNSFPSEVSSLLGHYVYRLIDPRNGETFYVGKGVGDRIFAHAAGVFIEASETKDDKIHQSRKIERIRRIQLDGMAVQHVIHRYGLDEKTAYEVEAALMDAYPGLTNIAGGHGSAERGVAHVEQIMRKYTAKSANILHSVVEVTINRTAATADPYHAARFAWKLNVTRARKAEFVIAVADGIVVDVFVPREWLPVTAENFPDHEGADSYPDRFGFVGRQADDAILQHYKDHRMPVKTKGASNPIRYLEPSKANVT